MTVIVWKDRPRAQQVALITHYKKKKAGTLPRPKNRKVLGGTVPMTPRRQEILWHVAYSDHIIWHRVPDWTNRWASGHKWAAFIGKVDVSDTLMKLRRLRLVTWGPRPLAHRDEPELRITVKGMAAALEYANPELSS